MDSLIWGRRFLPSIEHEGPDWTPTNYPSEQGRRRSPVDLPGRRVLRCLRDRERQPPFACRFHRNHTFTSILARKPCNVANFFNRLPRPGRD